MAGAVVLIDGKNFGVLPEQTTSGQWYSIKPDSSLCGTSIAIQTTRDVFLQIADIQVFANHDQAEC